MYQGYKIIDADAHFYEPWDIWDKYVEPEHHDRRPRVVGYAGRSRMDYKLDGVFFTKSRITDATVKRYANQEEKYGDAYRSWWSCDSRVKDMDKYGWDVQVCLPTSGHVGAQMSRKDPKLGAAVVRAYNNWARDYCNESPQRVKFAAVVPGGDSAELVLETRRAVEKLGAVTIIISTPAPGHWWHMPEFDPVWQAAEELEIPLSLHGNETQTADPATFARYNGMGGPFEAMHHAINFPMENMIGMAHFMLGGILDRFPTLKLSILESNCGWLPFWLSRLENCTHGRQEVTFDADPLGATPFEYFNRQCFIAADADELGIKFAIEHVGDDRIVFNTDYPHADAPDPWEPVPSMLQQPISDESRRKIFWDNSVSLYGSRLLES
jgi:predicted TIM-barrel fold metal-dependent hydrolase